MDDASRAEEHIAASVVLAGLSAAVGNNKHSRDDNDSPDTAGGVKKIRHQPEEAPPPPAAAAPADAEMDESSSSRGDLQPYPFFYYTDHSQDDDPDSLTPLTPPGRVPNFPAKMHAIMSRPDLADVICWMDHGRSWKVLKPREFEIRVIPIYFEHAKFSSFIRQANGWGFRRITAGRDRNSYYHPLFLRSLPHLCKKMKRPGVSKKLAADPEHEPDLYKISELHPVPSKPVDDSILLQCILQGGPKARMPIYSGIVCSAGAGTTFGGMSAATAASPTKQASPAATSMTGAATKLTPTDHETLSSFQATLGSFTAKTSNATQKPPAKTETTQSKTTAQKPAAAMPVPFVMPPFMMQPPAAFSPTFPSTGNAANQTLSALMAANQLAFGQAANPFAAMQASQFAAGFAAAAALNQQQMQSMLHNMQQQQQKPKEDCKEPAQP